MPKSPLIDVTSVNAVQSLLSQGTRDPWAHRLTAEFADFIIYNDVARYAFIRSSVEQETSASSPHSNSFARAPELLQHLLRHCPQVLEEETYLIADEESVVPDILPEMLEALFYYTMDAGRKKKVDTFMKLHNSPGFKNDEATIARRRDGRAFSIQQIRALPLFGSVTTSSGLAADDVCHLLEMLLKYPLYGEMAGADTYYLAHPLRLEISLPGIQKHAATPPHVPLPLGQYLANVAPRLGSESFARLLLAAREAVRDLGIEKLSAQEVQGNRKELISHLTTRLKLEARLKCLEDIASFVQYVCKAIATIQPANKELATAVDLGISMTKRWWNRPLRPHLAKQGWIQWLVTYDIEKYEEGNP